MDRSDLHSHGRGPGCLPLVLDDWLGARAALEILDGTGQSMAFVAAGDALGAVVTRHDLDFACDWAGPDATVADAVTCALVDIAAGSDPADVAHAFSDAQARWHAMARVRTASHPGSG